MALLHPSQPHIFWKSRWGWKGPQRISVFLWIAAHNKLLTAQRRSFWLGTTSDCPKCQGVYESVLYVLRDCLYANSLWLQLVAQDRVVEFFSSDHGEWFSRCLSKDFGKLNSLRWEDVFHVTCWFTWTWRNKTLFSQGFSPPQNRFLVVQQFVKELASVTDPLEINLIRNKISEVKWRFPPDG